MSVASFDEEFDCVVVGSGGGSMCAGLLARSAGRSVLILEKTAYVGGTTARSGGVMWIPDNPLMKRDGIEDGFDQAMAYLESLAADHPPAPGATPERRAAYVRGAPRMIAFLLAQGIKLRRTPRWPDYYDERPGGSKIGRTLIAQLFDADELGPWKARLRPGMAEGAAYVHEGLKLRTFKVSWAAKATVVKAGLRTAFTRLIGRRYLNAGAALQGRMLQAALGAGVDIRTETPVDALIVEDGAVKGVVCQRDGRPWRVGARLCVLVNAGGFARNQAMRDRHQPGTRAEWSAAAEGDTGEMIQEMIRVGAATGQMEEMVGYQSTVPPGAENAPIKPGVQAILASPHAILVDQTGVRYQNEGGSYMAFCKGMLARDRIAPAVPSWGVVDGQYMRRYYLPGASARGDPTRPWIRSGHFKKAGGLEDLARLLQMDPGVLKATVERFNGFVARGRDEDFQRGERDYDRWLGDPDHRPSATLGTIAAPPFYAIPVVPGDVGTYGGVITDEHGRVLGADDSVIAGLYATGVCTASVMGRAYPGAGGSLGPSFTFGYLALRHALGLP